MLCCCVLFSILRFYFVNVMVFFGRIFSVLIFRLFDAFSFLLFPLNPLGHAAGLIGNLFESCLIGSVRSLVNLNVVEW